MYFLRGRLVKNATECRDAGLFESGGGLRVILTGANGLLGRNIVSQKPQDVELLCLSRGVPLSPNGHFDSHILDILDFPLLEDSLLTFQPDVVINAAAEGRVDEVQDNQDKYRKLNVELPAFLAKYAFDSGSYFIQISSNAVFGGSGLPYADLDPLTPINDYGKLKAAAEHAVIEANHEALIVRPILMYGWPYPGGRLNPAVAWVEALRSGSPVRVVNDVWTEPLAAWDCASAVWKGVELKAAGPINVSGGQRMSLFEFAHLTAQAFELDPAGIVAISSDSLSGLAPRPVDTSFDLARLRNEFELATSPPRLGLRDLRRMN